MRIGIIIQILFFSPLVFEYYKHDFSGHGTL